MAAEEERRGEKKAVLLLVEEDVDEAESCVGDCWRWRTQSTMLGMGVVALVQPEKERKKTRRRKKLAGKRKIGDSFLSPLMAAIFGFLLLLYILMAEI